MDEYLNKGIKEIIDACPEVGSILNDYDIGCGPCNVGTCLLKDIVAIHRLPENREQELMARIADTLGRPEDTSFTTTPKKTEVEPKEFNYSPPVRKLDEQVSTHQIGELYSKFKQADQQVEVAPEKYEAFIDRLEKKFK